MGRMWDVPWSRVILWNPGRRTGLDRIKKCGLAGHGGAHLSSLFPAALWRLKQKEFKL